MSRFDSGNPPKREMITTKGVEVLINDPAPAARDEAPGAAPPAPQRGNRERDAFIADLDKKWGRFIDGGLRHPDLPAESIKDLHQKALMTLSEHYDKLSGSPAQVVKFVDTVVMNLLRNRLRQASLDVVRGVEEDVRASSSASPEHKAIRAQRWKKLEVYMGRLTPAEREVLKARELDGMTFEVIAAAVGRPLATVFGEHARAMKKLKGMARASERNAELGARRRNGAR